MDINDSTPTILERFIGQHDAVQLAMMGREYAYAEGEPFPNSLMVGPPGVGKTLLAKTIGHEMGITASEVLGQNLCDACYLRGVLVNAVHRDVLFIDESDELPKPVQVLLYRAIEDKKLFLPFGIFTKTQTSVALEDFTILLATNHESSLLKPLRDRFAFTLRFTYYSVDELTAILAQRVGALGWNVPDGILPKIAARSQGVPRLALRLLQLCYMTAKSAFASTISDEHLRIACEHEGLDNIGLNRDQSRYLRIVANASVPIRRNVLGTKLGLPAKTIAHVIEPFLVRSDFIVKTDKGRQITPRGLLHLKSQEQGK